MESQLSWSVPVIERGQGSKTLGGVVPGGESDISRETIGSY
jgi:hypothetical protein